MADTDKPARGPAGGTGTDTALVRALAELLAETGLTEIEVEESGRRIRVARGHAPVAAVDHNAAPVPAPAVAAAPAAAAPAEPAADEPAMTSPMVGTVYLAAEPGAPNFVSVGDTVREGQTLLIIEAMKVMNPIAADRAGKIKAVLVDNAQPVEFGQPLVVIA
ncbi:acetyl-CoA carboxylase biotin carboxyl carrier protein [Qipengyuania sediminis]|uniref:acetyl-CoA carboxylase biotin carboxyl carrier protein n=1 Tax=Qipengyuania sediminis TaxID=1532023 RepID=UPI00105A406D|nr:acetyl-CoA carboxylase biotin carboxyl carrier protein [Qipengyuania sediminis]